MHFDAFWLDKSKDHFRKEINFIRTHTENVPKPDGWGVTRDHLSYYYIDYKFQYKLSQIPEEHRMNYLAQRYAHLLSTAQSMGTMAITISVLAIANAGYAVAAIFYLHVCRYLSSKMCRILSLFTGK